MPCVKGREERAKTGSTAGRERGALTLGMTSLQWVVNTRKLMFTNKEWVVNIFSVELAVNLYEIKKVWSFLPRTSWTGLNSALMWV